MSNLGAKLYAAISLGTHLLVRPTALSKGHNHGRSAFLGPGDGLLDYSNFTFDGRRIKLFQANDGAACPHLQHQQPQRHLRRQWKRNKRTRTRVSTAAPAAPPCLGGRSASFTLPVTRERVETCTRGVAVREIGGNSSGWVVRPVETWTLPGPTSRLMRGIMHGVYNASMGSYHPCALAPSLARVARAVAHRLLGRNYTALHVRGGDMMSSAQRYISPGNVARVLQLASPAAEGNPIFVMSNEPRSVVTRMLSGVKGRRVVLSHDIRSLPIVAQLLGRNKNNYILFLLESIILRLATTRITTFAMRQAFTNETFWHASLGGSNATRDAFRQDTTGQVCSLPLPPLLPSVANSSRSGRPNITTNGPPARNSSGVASHA